MRRAFYLSANLCWLLVATASAFEVDAVIKQVDLEGRRLIVEARQERRSIQVPADVKVFDPSGKELAEGLKSGDLHEGVRVVLVVERAGDRPSLRQIRLGGGAAPAAAPPAFS